MNAEQDLEIALDEERKSHEQTLVLLQASERKRLALQSELEELLARLDAVRTPVPYSTGQYRTTYSILTE